MSQEEFEQWLNETVDKNDYVCPEVYYESY